MVFFIVVTTIAIGAQHFSIRLPFPAPAVLDISDIPMLGFSGLVYDQKAVIYM